MRGQRIRQFSLISRLSSIPRGLILVRIGLRHLTGQKVNGWQDSIRSP
jgi:hypothetical protein